MYSYVLRRLLLMIPTFVGITLLAYFVMQLARQDAYQQELMQAMGTQGQSGEAGASGSGGPSYAGAISLEQIERLRRNYEMHLPIILNFDVWDRSDWADESLQKLLDPFPAVSADRLKIALKRIKAQELLQSLTNYLNQSRDLDQPWYFDEQFANTFVIQLGALEFSRYREVIKPWKSFRRELEKRNTFRQEYDKAHRDLLTLKERLLLCWLPDIFNWSEPQRQQLALTYLQNIPSLADIKSLEDLKVWWSTHQQQFFSENINELTQALLNSSDSDKTQLAEDFFQAYPSLFAESLYDSYGTSLSFETRRQLINYFERATRAEGIPYIEVLDEKRVKKSWQEVKKWWRKNDLNFVEISWWQRLGRTLTVTRYGGWFLDMLRLDFRHSESLGIPVIEAIKSRLPISIQFGLTGFILGYLVCIPLGIAKAIRHGTTFDFETSFLVFIGYSIPGWALGAVLLMVFGGGTFPEFEWFPLRGFQSDNFDQLDFWAQVKDRVWHAVLPVISYSVGSFATLTVLMKNSLMENLGADYVRTAFAKGLSERRVILVHTVRNSLIPLCVGLGHILSLVLAGSYLVEKVFEIHGFGLMGYNALINYDINLLMGTLVIGSLLRLWGNLFSDILYSIVDPRIRFK